MKYVETQDKLKAAVRHVAAASRLAVDTEADSLHRYFEKLCLVQVSTPDDDYVFDPLAGLDLSELMRVLEERSLIFHGADFDLRLLHRAYKFNPHKIFDTLLAAQLLGLEGQGLQALAGRFCAVHLPKANQKADWSRRPLTKSMLDYAAGDTHYLHALAGIMERDLVSLGRMSWLEESCADLIQATKIQREIDPATRWRIKGWHLLEGRELVLLRAVWDWREELARRVDRPSFKVVNNEALIAMAKWKTAHPRESVGEMPHLPSHMDDVKIREIDHRFERAFLLPLEPIEKPRPKKEGRRLTEPEKKRLDALKEVRKKISADVKCDPGVLAPNAALEAIVLAAPKDAETLTALGRLKRWQVQLVAPAFLEVLNRKDP